MWPSDEIVKVDSKFWNPPAMVDKNNAFQGVFNKTLCFKYVCLWLFLCGKKVLIYVRHQSPANRC